MAVNGFGLMEFGSGDVGVFSGCSVDIGLIAFRTLQEPKEIGVDKLTVEEYGGVENILRDSDIIMTFSNKRSVDVVIRALNKIRDNLED